MRYSANQLRMGRVGGCEKPCFVEQGGGAGDLDQVQRVDDADATAGSDAGDRLRVLEVGVHAGVGRDEPCAEVFGGFRGALTIFRDAPRRGEGGHLHGEA